MAARNKIEPEEIAAASGPARLRLLAKSGYIRILIFGLLIFASTAVFTLMQYRAASTRLQQTEEYNLLLKRSLVEVRSALTSAHESLSRAQSLLDQADAFPQKTAISAQIAQARQSLDAVPPALNTLSISKLSDSGRLRDALSFVTPAFADAAEPAASTQDMARFYVIMVIFIVLGITFLASILAIFFTSSPQVLSFALDTVKTLLGFFIGVATTFFSLPTPHS